MTSSPQLARLIREGRWSDLETSWTEMILENPELEPALDAVAAAARKKELPRCLALVKEQGEMLIKSERPADAARLLGEAMLQGGSPGELAALLYTAAHSAWGSADSWEAYCDLADFRENQQDMRQSWRDLRKLVALEKGQIIYHAKGWGLGEVEEVYPADQEAKVRFSTGRMDRFPFKTAIEIFEFLPPNDLRALVVTNQDELARILKEEPLTILRWILERNNGKATQASIKLAMGTLGVEAGRFTAWWRKAKKAAEADEWIELSGSATKAQLRLLDVASDPNQAIQRQLKRAKSLAEALQRVRALVTGGAADPAVLASGLETLAELSEEDRHPLPERLSTWIFLREQSGKTPERLAALYADAAEQPVPQDPSQAPELWKLCQAIPGMREQERSIELLREVLGDEWIQQAAVHLPHASAGMVKSLIDTLSENGHTEALLTHYRGLLARPLRNPIVLIRLAEHIERGSWDDELPPLMRRAQTLLQMAVQLVRTSAGNTHLTRARARLNDVLTKGDAPLMRHLLRGASIEDLRRLATMLEAGVDREVDRLFTRIAVEISPAVFREEERPFWELPGTWTTSAGLARREEELRILTEVKIPENSEAIGKAASFGDLSENSEWEAAIADQRTLTNRAMELEIEIREAQLLENVGIPKNTVAPGTRVRYKDAEDGQEHEIEIVGPWDVTHDGQISYRSPLAAGMLGGSPGSTATVSLPSGEKEVEILSVALLPSE